MAHCTKNSITDKEIQHDVEALSKSCDEILPDSKEKSMSPVLSGGLSNRKLLMGNRSRLKKNRVKLSDRFSENNKQKEHSNQSNNSDIRFPEFFEDSLTPSQNECILNRIEKLEKIENYRQNIYKIMVTDRQNSVCFKKPLSPTPNKNKEVKITNTCGNNLDIVESEYHIETFSINKDKIDLSTSSSFQTATGKCISISETDIKKYSKLFDDIINPSQDNEGDRNRKYAFLSKRKSNISIKQDDSIPIKAVLSENSVSVKKLTRDLLNNPLAERSRECAKFCKEQLGDTEDKQIVQSNKLENSLTQQIYESGITNTQMLCAMDDVLSCLDGKQNNEVSTDECADNFKGFDKKEATESHNFFQRLVNSYQSFEDITKKINKKHNRSIFSINDILGENVGSIERFKKIELNHRKHIITDLPLPPKKRIRNYDDFESVVNENENRVQNVESKMQILKSEGVEGFSSASGKLIKVSEKSLNKARHTFKDMDLNFCQSNLLSERHDFGTSLNLTETRSFEGFSSASGKSIKISANSLKKAQSIFDNMDLDLSEDDFAKVKPSNITTSDDKLKLLDDAQKTMVWQTENEAKLDLKTDNSQCLKGNEDFSTPTRNQSGNLAKEGHTPLRKVKNIFDDFDLKFPVTNKPVHNSGFSATCGFQTAGGSKLRVSEEALRKAQTNYNKIEDEVKTEEITPIKTSDLSLDLSGSEGGNLSTKRSKRRLGVSFCKQIQIPDSKLNKAKLLFEEDFHTKSPIRPNSSIPTYTSTPLRQNFCTTPARNDIFRPSKSFNSLIDTPSITPIRKCEGENPKEINFLLIPNPIITLVTPTKGSTFDWINELEIERKKLEDRLRIVTERQRALKSRSREKSVDDKRPKKGILYQYKCRDGRISLSSLKNEQKLANADHFCYITPQNAENMHFKEQFSGTVATQDGAVVIPNSKDTIGLSEIESAFSAMPSVEPCLIPNGWLRNHYKWIVWKLSSYERMFPLNLGGCLCVENVVQQLKYRYDREIDRAERSALRKIYEKDDVPQKRMVLCVSDIKKVNINKCELELTDGWYGIRTIIDEPLCNQVFNGKIKTGTKLMICMAELLNCDGCYPLEATDLVSLRINFNSTRRAIWHAKLGFQRNLFPFVIPIRSIHPIGGLIGAITVCIVRVYPFKYFERLENYTVWRNKKAEELRAQEWENEKCKKLEQLMDDISKNFDHSQSNQNVTVEKECSNIPDITCPKTLYEILKNSKDPDCVQQMLTSSQRAAILDYQSNLSMRRHEEMVAKVNEDVQKLKLTRRNVSAVLRLLVIDASCTSDKALNFFIWSPTESHTQLLREGTFVTIQNVLAKKNGDLSSSMRTVFKPEHSNRNNMCEKFLRRLFQIADLFGPNFSTNFDEFDTVGVVVQTDIGFNGQEVWLADYWGRMLLVDICEEPSTCLLLDNLKRGQATSVCNLTYLGVKNEVAHALGNHFTVFSSYSQYRHLQEGLEVFKKNLPKNMEELLDDCDSKIELFKLMNSDLRNTFSTTFVEDSNEDTLTSSRNTTTDVAVSLIDFNKPI